MKLPEKKIVPKYNSISEYNNGSIKYAKGWNWAIESIEYSSTLFGDEYAKKDLLNDKNFALFKKDESMFYKGKYDCIIKIERLNEEPEDTEESDDTKAQPMNRSEAYKIVFDDLTKCNMFKGIYDAANGKPSFMYGISTVMECIASKVSEDCYEQFMEEFVSNMIDSKAKAEQIERKNKL